MSYPPAPPDAQPSSTPARTSRLNSRGTILPGIQQVMAALQEIYPRRYYPKDGSREAVIDPNGWRRGGTSPGGASLGGTPGGNYFVGDSDVGDGAPQRIVWEFPREGEEEWLPAQRIGPFVDPSTANLPELLIPQSPATGAQYRAMGDETRIEFAVRIIPMRVHLWGNDVDDSEELLHEFTSAFVLAMGNNILNRSLITSSGWIQESKGTRGLHPVVTVCFCAPVHYPRWAERAVRSVSLRPEIVQP